LPSHVLPPRAFSRLGHSNLAASADIWASLADTAITESATVRAAVCFSVHWAESRWVLDSSRISLRYRSTALEPPTASSQVFWN
jgi:hypothetical protein